MLAFTRDRFDDAVTSKDELQTAAGGATVMALIPLGAAPGPSEEQVVSISRPTSSSAEAYRILRASIQIRDQLEGGGLRVLAVTSPEAGEGKTSTVANLGVALARTGQRVVIVDYDLRRPRMDAVFRLSSRPGIISVLLGENNLASARQEVEGQPGLSVVAAGQVPPNPSEILSLGSAHKLVQELRAQADFVLIDCPPVLPVPDSLAVAQMVDGVILVAAAHRTSKRSIVHAFELLEQVGTPIVGSVLNGVRESRGGGYGYGYGYVGNHGEVASANGRSSKRDRRKMGQPAATVSGSSGVANGPPQDRTALESRTAGGK